MTKESLQLFKELIHENGRAIPITHPELVQVANTFAKALQEIEEELNKGESNDNSQGSSI